mgnify:CR=1 FL=1
MLLSFSMNAQAESDQCYYVEKTYIDDDTLLKTEEAMLFDEFKTINGLPDELPLKVVKTSVECSDDITLNNIKENLFTDDVNKTIPMCLRAGCIISFPGETAVGMTYFYCDNEKKVKTKIKYRKLPDGRYEIIKITEENVTSCNLKPDE